MYRINKLTIDGVCYQKDMVIILNIDSGTPCFGKIMEVILTPSEEIMFAVSLLHTLQYHYHFHAYETVDTTETDLYQYKDLSTYHPLELSKPYGTQNKTMICLKYHVF